MCVVSEVVWCTSFFVRDARKNSLVRVRFRTLTKLFFRAVHWTWKKRRGCLRILCFTQNSCGVVVRGRWYNMLTMIGFPSIMFSGELDGNIGDSLVHRKLRQVNMAVT